MAQKKVTINLVTPKRKKVKRTKPLTAKQRATIEKNKFKPGQSGNPNGRPKGSGAKKISGAYEFWLNEKVPEFIITKLGLREKLGVDKSTEITWNDVIGLSMILQAVDPRNEHVRLSAVEELRTVTEGPIPTKIEQTGKDGAPLSAPPIFAVNFVDPKTEPEKK